MEGTSVYFDEAAVVFCGHACTGDELHPDILPDPRTWAEAMDQPDWQEWVEASKTERRNLRKRKTYRVLSKAEVKNIMKQGKRIHTCKNVMKKKINAQGQPYKHKSRAAFRGFTQVNHFDFHETFAAVASSGIVRLVVALSVGARLTMHQLDVVGAYLNAHMAEELYMWAPEGIAKSEGECWQILSQLYGTRSAGAAWKELFVKLTMEFGFENVNMDDTLFVLRDEATDRLIVICMYVDDTIVAENWPSKFNQFVQHLSKHVEITDEGFLNWYLSVRYRSNVDSTRIFASQTAYIEKMATKEGLDPDSKKGPKTPMDANFTVEASELPEEADVDPELRTACKSILGGLLFPAGWCRPDCSFAVNKLTRYAARPFPGLYEAAIRVLKYMVRTKNKGIRFSCLPQDLHGHKVNQLYCFVDASFADDLVK